jgi:hypothetical protein
VRLSKATPTKPLEDGRPPWAALGDNAMEAAD